MASLINPSSMPHSHYPSSGSMQHANNRPVADDGPGSFGPVLVVMAVISFLVVSSCVAGRLCGRGSSSRETSKQQSVEADNGLGAKHLEVMRPLPSSRATVHDADDPFEIRLVPQKPAGSEASGGIRLQALPQPRQLGTPRQYPSAAAGAAGFRVPASANIGADAARQAHPM